MKNAKLEKASKYKKWYIITSISPLILELIFVLMGWQFAQLFFYLSLSSFFLYNLFIYN